MSLPQAKLPLMTIAEASEVVESIKQHSSSIRALLVELDAREGWRALGFSSMRACVEAEFEIGSSHLYRELAAAEIEMNTDSPVGEISERLLRPLTVFTPDVQAMALTVAKSAFPGQPLTARAIKAAVNVLNDAIATKGRVDAGDGTMTALGAAITQEVYEIGQRQRQHIRDNQKPLALNVTGTIIGTQGLCVMIAVTRETLRAIQSINGCEVQLIVREKSQ